MYNYTHFTRSDQTTSGLSSELRSGSHTTISSPLRYQLTAITCERRWSIRYFQSNCKASYRFKGYLPIFIKAFELFQIGRGREFQNKSLWPEDDVVSYNHYVFSDAFFQIECTNWVLKIRKCNLIGVELDNQRLVGNVDNQL